MKVTGSIRFDMEFDNWQEGWKKLEKLAKIVDETKIAGEIGSMGFQ